MLFLKRLFIAIVILFNCSSCVFLEKAVFSFSSLFQGGTQNNMATYSLEEKAEYNRYLHQQKVLEKEKGKKILKRMDMTCKQTKKDVMECKPAHHAPSP